MKHPLTSKERRGLTAVAAAALLCIASGFVFRSCGYMNRPHVDGKTPAIIIENDSLVSTQHSANDQATTNSNKKRKDTKSKSDSGSDKKKRKSKKNKTEKNYPVRDPLSQPCD